MWGVLCAAALLLSGCGSAAGAEGGLPGNSESFAASGGGAMGRYMETAYELPREINRNGGLNRLADGSWTIISYGSGLYRSVNEGKSWQQEDTVWYPMLENVYCLDAVMGPDGTVAASCSGEMSELVREAYGQPVEDDWEGNYCVFGMPGGTVKIVDFGFTQEDGSCISSFCFKEDGRLFASDISGRVYEVNVENASLKELFMAERAVGYMDFYGSVLLAVGYDRLYQYDLSRDVLLAQDETVDAFIQQTLTDGSVAYTGGGYPLIVFGGEDENTIYIACEDGLYRHALGGSVMEQVIDGALSSLGDASSVIYNGELLEGQEFLIMFNPSVGVIQYTFDESIPSMPDKEIRIYSLEENASVRQAVTAYKKEHTDMYVRYEVGMEGESGITAEDALKKLNTQILAGKGPDVLILDGLPLNTYIEKGLLLDMSSLFDRMDGRESLFSNLVDSFTDESGAIYAMPMCVQVPLLAGNESVIDNMDDLGSFADAMEELRTEIPAGGLLGICDAETLLRLFGMVSSPAWVDADGQMDASAVKEFLEQMKRIYEAELSGVISEQAAVLEEEDALLAQYGIDVQDSKMEVCQNVLNIPRGYAALACGYVDGIQLCLDNVTSAAYEVEGLSYRLFGGQAGRVFLPKALVGISAGSGQPEEAEEFVQKMFSEETQENMYEGFPVNRAAFEGEFSFMEDHSYNGSMLLQKSDGSEMELTLYWPTDEEEQSFREYVEALDTPALTGSYLCELVYETGKRVLEDEISAEDGTAEIVKRAAIYLAE